MSGNKIYYIAGSGGAEYRDITELETIGLTHPFFRDGRARGYGIVDADKIGIKGGKGHDVWGWEFWRHTKVAYGTVIIDDVRIPKPKPKALYWRPDKLIVEYELFGIKIREIKFISKNDVLSTVITSSKPLKIEFEGQSFNNPNNTPTFDGDPPNQPMTVTSDAIVHFDKKNNAINVYENGETITKPQWGEKAVVGKMMYSGLNFILSSNEPIYGFEKSKLLAGNIGYKFSIDIPSNSETIISYAVNENPKEALARIEKDQIDIFDSVREKTDFINSLLNYQIPYFRSSDEMFNKAYYYLWSLYFMYFTDIKKGYEKFPHTQTAINNFMGLHLWDSWAYCAAASYVVDKDKWGYGNALSWQFMVPFKDKNNALPDNFGTSWYSPQVRMNFEGAVEHIWEMYRKSGDTKFLNHVYRKLLRPLYIDNDQRGLRVNSGESLYKIASELGEIDDAVIFKSFVNKKIDWFKRNRWKNLIDQYDGKKQIIWKDIWDLVHLRNNSLPPKSARSFIDKYVMDTDIGFISPVGLNTRAADSPPNGIFRASSISCWLAVDGLFRKNSHHAGTVATLNHFNAMTREYGYPIAPEAWDHKFQGWGSRYYNWDIAMVLPVIRWLGGVDYSLLDSSFQFSPYLPQSWEFIEMYTPISLDGKTSWVNTKINRVSKNSKHEFKYTIKGNPLENTYIKSHYQNRVLLDEKTNLNRKKSKEGSIFFTNNDNAEVNYILGEKLKREKTLVWMHPKSEIFFNPILVSAENLIPGTIVRYTTDESLPTEKSPIFSNKIVIDTTTTFNIRSFGNDTAYLPYKFTYHKAYLNPSISEDKNFEPGLDYILYELPKKLRKLPDFSKLRKIKSGTISTNDLSPNINFKNLNLDVDKHFGMHISGYIKIREDNVYNFNLKSDDGSILFIDDKEIIRLNSVSGLDPWIFDGKIGLKKGLHKIDIFYTQYTKNSFLELTAKLPDELDFKNIPANLFMTKKYNN